MAFYAKSRLFFFIFEVVSSAILVETEVYGENYWPSVNELTYLFHTRIFSEGGSNRCKTTQPLTWLYEKDGSTPFFIKQHTV